MTTTSEFAASGAPTGAVTAPSGDARPAPTPAASPRARWWTITLGLALLAAGGVAVHDLLVVRGTVQTDPWLTPVYDWIADLHYAAWVLPAAIACAVAALILFVAAVKPRTKTHLHFTEDTALFARPVDVARMSTASAKRIGGVIRASTIATRKKITVTVVTAAGDAGERQAVSDGVAAEVTKLASLLDPTPSVQVRTTTATRGGERR